MLKSISDITRLRLCNQQITCKDAASPEELVSAMGAIQAQDYSAAKWAIGLRLHNFTDPEIEQAIADKKIIRTWPMRGTLHFVAAKDVIWMLRLLTPKIIASSARRNRELGLNDRVFEDSGALFSKILKGGRQLNRKEMMEVLERHGISTRDQRGYHILWHLSQTGLLCFGPGQGRQQTFVLLNEWAGDSKELTRDKALSEIAKRYFMSRGPATIQDFVWWTGLSVGDCRAAVEMNRKNLLADEFDGREYLLSKEVSKDYKSQSVHLLPAYDEYIISYRDRSCILDPKDKSLVVSSNGIFYPAIIINGKVAGTWRRTIGKDSITLILNLHDSLSKSETSALKAAAANYSRFMDKPVILDK